MKKAVRRSNRKGFYYKRGAIAAFSPLSLALFEAMEVQPDDDRKDVIDTTMRALNAAGLLSDFDLLFIRAAHDEQAARVSWITPGTFTSVAHDSPVFTEDRGFNGNGVGYLDLEWTASSDGVRFTLNSASAFIWSLTDDGAYNLDDMGVFGGGGGSIELGSRYGDDTARGGVNASNLSGAVTDSMGLLHADRIGANDVVLYKNGAALASSGANTATAVPAASLFELTASAGGSPITSSTRTICASGVGAGLGPAKAAALHGILLAYMQAVGAVA